MNLNDICVIQNEDMKCEELSIATMANYWNLEYETMFRDKLYFDYVSNSKCLNLIGERLYVNHNENVYNLLERYHGIIIRPYDNTENFIMNQLMNNNPIMIYFDQFYAPWLEEKDKIDIERGRGYLLLIDYINEYKKFYCVDIHKTKKIQSISYDDFMYGCNKLSCKSISIDSSKIMEIEYEQILKESLEILYRPKVCANNSFEAMRLFANDIMYIDVEAEFAGYKNIFYSPLSEKFRSLCQNTSLYLLFLDYIKKYFCSKKLENFYNEIAELNIKWKSLTAYFFKNYFKNTFTEECKHNIKNRIMQISQYQENIVTIMLDRKI